VTCAVDLPALRGKQACDWLWRCRISDRPLTATLELSVRLLTLNPRSHDVLGVACNFLMTNTLHLRATYMRTTFDD